MQSHKHLKEALYSILGLCIIIWVIVYIQIRSAPVEDQVIPVDVSQQKSHQLLQVSQDLKVQEPTVQFKKKLQAVSASLNK